MTTAQKIRETVEKTPSSKTPSLFSDFVHSLAMWIKGRGLSDRVPANAAERKLKIGGSYRVDNGIQEVVLPNGFVLLAFEGADSLQLSIVDSKHRNVGTLFRETYYSMPPINIYDLSCGGTLETSGEVQKVCMPDGVVVALDSRGVVLISDGQQTEQLRKPYLKNSGGGKVSNLALLHPRSAERQLVS